MKTLRNVTSAVMVLAVLFLGSPSLYAGDEEWADAGKVLAGVVGGVVGYHILSNMYGGSYYTPRRSVCGPQVVYYDDPYSYEEGYASGYGAGYYDGYRYNRYYRPHHHRRVIYYY